MASHSAIHVFHSEEYIFAEDFVHCINFHFSIDIGWVKPCPKPKSRTTLLTPQLEKLLIKLLFSERRTLIRQFYDRHKNINLSLHVFKLELNEETRKFLFFIEKKIKNCYKSKVSLFLMRDFFHCCLKIGTSAVLFHRGGKALESLNIAISEICFIIKRLQQMKYWNKLTWNELTVWGPEFESLYSDSDLGLVQVHSDFMNTVYFKFIESANQTKFSSNCVKATPDDCTNSELNKSMTLAQMILKATQLTTHYYKNTILNQSHGIGRINLPLKKNESSKDAANILPVNSSTFVSEINVSLDFTNLHSATNSHINQSITNSDAIKNNLNLELLKTNEHNIGSNLMEVTQNDPTRLNIVTDNYSTNVGACHDNIVTLSSMRSECSNTNTICDTIDNLHLDQSTNQPVFWSATNQSSSFLESNNFHPIGVILNETNNLSASNSQNIQSYLLNPQPLIVSNIVEINNLEFPHMAYI